VDHPNVTAGFGNNGALPTCYEACIADYAEPASWGKVKCRN
jgi:hypothetical protein